MTDSVIVALVAFVALWGAKKSFWVGFLLYFAHVVTAWQMPEGIYIGQFAGLAVSLADILFVVSIALAATHYKRVSIFMGKTKAPFLLFFGLTLVALVRGVTTFGLSAAVNEARLVLYFIGAILWFAYQASVLKVGQATWARAYFISGVSVLTVEISNVAAHGFGDSRTGVQLSTNLIQTQRPLVSIQALFLLSVVTFFVFYKAKSKITNQMRIWFAITCLIAILISQQRSVWLATLATLGVLLCSQFTRKLSLVFISCLAFLLLVISQTSFGQSTLSKALSESFTDNATLVARTGSWEQYLSSMSNASPIDYLIGRPFGSGWGRYDGLSNLWVEFNPHNWYLIALLRTGVVGLVVTVLFIILRTISKTSDRQIVVENIAFQVQSLVFQFFYPAAWQVPQLYGSKKQPEPEGSGSLIKPKAPVRRKIYEQSDALSKREKRFSTDWF